MIVGDGIIGSIGETEVKDDASVSPSKGDVNLDEVVNQRDRSESWVIVDTEGSNWASEAETEYAPEDNDKGGDGLWTTHMR